MKVAFVNQPFDERYGDNKNSIALWTYRAAKELQNQHQVTIFCKHLGQDEAVDKEGITYRVFDTEEDERRYAFRGFSNYGIVRSGPCLQAVGAILNSINP
ncbi:MAG: hypothetical protein O7C75_11995 [Verrucomicrobia bacterium]|nr:hypothetical protein [Verrucomicrobiota bacterium]